VLYERETAGGWSRVAATRLSCLWPASIIRAAVSATIYLDNNATTRVADEVVAAMTPYYREHFGNPHSVHSLGRRAHEAVEEARRSIAQALDCDAAEIVFNSCGTEGNAMVLRGLIDASPQRRKIVTTAVEHPSVLSLLRALPIELAITRVNSEGEIDLDAMSRLVDENTLLVSAMLVQNETGVVHPIARIAAIAHARGALLHVDAIQAVGKIPVSMRDLEADFLTISGHKFHAPKGVGALAIRRGPKLAPLWYGGGQELGLRSGTEPVPSLVGLGVAASLARAAAGSFDRVTTLRDRFERALRATVVEMTINCASQPRIGNTSSISFHDTAGDEIVRALDAEGLCVSAGAACHAGSVEPSATMKALGKPLRVAMGTVRFSLSRYTTEEEIDRASAIAPRVVAALRSGRGLPIMTL